MNKLLLIFNLISLVFSEPLITKNMVDYINSKQNFWIAHESPRFTNYTVDEISSLCGTFIHDDYKLSSKIHDDLSLVNIPDEFDARTQWPQCSTIGFARDQANCGSCWAFASTEAFNDRLCINSNGNFKQFLSTQATVDCCNLIHCFSFGCSGGQPAQAWNYFKSYGIVSGGNYEDIGKGQDCLPYQVQTCSHHIDDPSLPTCDSTTSGKAGSCPTQCSEKTYSTSYSNDIHKIDNVYSLSGVQNIQSDILAHGPVSAAFTVYEDFPSYKSGVYIYTTGKQLGGHAVKIIGWGVEDGISYWTVMNSWNSGWGDNGAFKIRRGTDECGIESMGVNGGTFTNNKYLRIN